MTDNDELRRAVPPPVDCQPPEQTRPQPVPGDSGQPSRIRQAWRDLTGPPADHEGPWPVPSRHADLLGAAAIILGFAALTSLLNIWMIDAGAPRSVQLIVSFLVVYAGIKTARTWYAKKRRQQGPGA